MLNGNSPYLQLTNAVFFQFIFDIMSQFNKKIEEIPIRDVLLIIILGYIATFFLGFLNLSIMGVINIVIILYFALLLKDVKNELKIEISNIFTKVSFKEILFLVLINICFSYGMLYLSNYIINLVHFDSYLGFFIPVKSILGVLSLISIVFISPVAEELIFRGVFLNKLKFIIPTVFAILISSLLFASLHSFGSIFSAFLFGVCMALLYLKTENIFVPMLAHFLNNLIGESLYHIDYADLLFSNSIVMGIMSVLAIVSFIFILKFIHSKMKNI